MADDVQANVYMEQGGDVLNVDTGGELQFEGRRRHIAKVALGADNSNGGVLAWQNPQDTAILVERVILDITSEATGSANIDVGSASGSGSTSDNLIDGQAIGDAVKVLDNIDDQGTNGGATVRLDANGGTTDWITGSPSADPAGLAGNAYIYFYEV